MKWAVLAGWFWVLSAGAAPDCPHPYFPMEDGLVLTYRAGKSEVQLSVSQVRRLAGRVQARLELVYEGRSAFTQVECGPSGVSAPGGGLEGLLLSSAGLDLTVISAEGPAIPPAAELVPGKAWKNHLALELRTPEGALASGISPVVRTRLEKQSEVVGVEEIQVEAGTFKALRLKNRTTAALSEKGEGRSVDSEMWIAPKVGIIRLSTGKTVDLELIRVKRCRG